MKRLSSVVLLAGSLTLYFAAWLVLANHSGSGGAAWRALHVPATERSFDDLRFLLHGVDCARAGINPYVDITCDWRFRPFNYPSVWLSLRHVGLTVAHSDAFGFVIAGLFIWSLLVVFKETNLLAGWLAVACALSPAVMLGIARGNIDLLIFSMTVAIAQLAFARPRTRDTVLAVGILVLSVLKLYPIAVTATLLRPGARKLVSVVVLTIAFAAWVFYTRDELALIQANTPAFAWKSFGYKTAFITVHQFFEPGIETPAGLYPAPLPALWRASAIALLLLVSVTSAVIGFRSRTLPAMKLDTENLRHFYFIAGASIYVLTFGLGANFQYRLIFLLWCLPLLADWLSQASAFRPFALLLAAAIVGECWLSAASGAPFELKARALVLRAGSEITSWALFAALAMVLASYLASVYRAVTPRLGLSLQRSPTA